MLTYTFVNCRPVQNGSAEVILHTHTADWTERFEAASVPTVQGPTFLTNHRCRGLSITEYANLLILEV